MKKIICLVLGLLVLASGCNLTLVSSPQKLPTVGSVENLKQLVEARVGENKYLMFETDMRATGAEAATDASAQTHSSTNVQVQGVDEADVVKTDGTYIYHIAGNKVLITQAWPADSLSIVKELEFDEGFFPNTLYVDDSRLVVIGSQREDNPENPEYSDVRHCLPWFTTVARVLVYDISDMSNVTQSNDITLDGYTVTSRKKDDVLYLINSRYVGLLIDGPEPTLPWYKESPDGEKQEIGYEDICYFPEGDLGEYILFAALDLNSGELNVDTYLGWAQNVYMSTENLYVAMSNWTDATTTVYRFAVNGTSLTYMAEGKVKGTVLNQFSMDEYDGHFRIATNYTSPMVFTETPDSPAEVIPPSNNVYVLDSSMQVVGQIENIAPGESIMSARFMGEKGYLVTFEQIDPLFVIDLSNPSNPTILGELKIPGFSTYLHPLDDQHLLGIGWDTELRSYEGREFVTTNGIKLAIFDVSDVNNPKEKHVVKIGKTGTWSEALYEHKAVFYHEGVLAFNAAIMDTDYKLTYQGALFYDVDLEAGFRELGRVTHIANPTGEWFEAYSGIKRVVQIGDVYYTVSDKYVMAHSKDSFAKLAGIELPALPEPEFYR